MNNKTEIASGADWHLRLSRHGRFMLSLNITAGAWSDIGEGFTANMLTGINRSQLWGAALHCIKPHDLLEIFGAVRAASSFDQEATARQKAYVSKIRKATAMSRAQLEGGDLQAALCELRDISEGTKL